MTTAEYATNFKELSRYTPKMVASDDARKIKFIHILKLDVVK